MIGTLTGQYWSPPQKVGEKSLEDSKESSQLWRFLSTAEFISCATEEESMSERLSDC